MSPNQDWKVTAVIVTAFAGLLTISCLRAEWRNYVESRRTLAPTETLTLVEAVVDGMRVTCIQHEDHVNGTKSLSC